MKPIKQTKQPKRTHRQKLREKYASNQLLLEKELGLSEVEYGELFFEVGMQFIERLYPVNSSYEPYRFKYSRSPSFWKWWRAEWKQIESRYINYIEKMELLFKREEHKRLCEHLVYEPIIEESFYSIYLKSISHEHI